MRRDRATYVAIPFPDDVPVWSMPGSDWLIKRVPLLPPWDSKPEFYEVELHDLAGDVVERITLVGRWLGSWLVITGHSGARHCVQCGQEITPLEAIVLVVPALEWSFDKPAPTGPENVRLWHDACHVLTYGRATPLVLPQ